MNYIPLVKKFDVYFENNLFLLTYDLRNINRFKQMPTRSDQWPR